MRKLIIAAIIIGFGSVAWAGEKEELSLQAQLIQTQMQVMQMQFEKAQEQLKVVQGKLQAIAVAEKAKKTEPKK